MIDSFPYPVLSRKQLINHINYLSFLQIPFLFIINYKADQGYVIKKEELDANYIQFHFEAQNVEHETQNVEHETLQWNINPLTINEYRTKYEYVQNQIQLGNSFLVNLTLPTKIQTNLSLFEIYNQSFAKYRLFIKNSLLVLSPETFVQIRDGQISSFPMKGTIDASIPNAEELILNDSKEKAEHATIVDLIRNDLSLVANQVEVKCYRYIEKITTNKQDLLQVSSEISGRLPVNYH